MLIIYIYIYLNRKFISYLVFQKYNKTIVLLDILKTFKKEKKRFYNLKLISERLNQIMTYVKNYILVNVRWRRKRNEILLNSSSIHLENNFFSSAKFDFRQIFILISFHLNALQIENRILQKIILMIFFDSRDVYNQVALSKTY